MLWKGSGAGQVYPTHYPLGSGSSLDKYPSSCVIRQDYNCSAAMRSDELGSVLILGFNWGRNSDQQQLWGMTKLALRCNM